MKESKFKDVGAERAVLGSIMKNGRDAFIDVSGILSVNDFTLSINRGIFQCLSEMANDKNCHSFDPESVMVKAKTLGLDGVFADEKNSKYLSLVHKTNVDSKNAAMFALQIKKMAIFKELYDRTKNTESYLEGLSGQEDIGEVIRKIESGVVDFVRGTESNELCDFASTIGQRIDELMNREPVMQIGLPTGFPLHDEAIGGGARRAAIDIVGARTKIGKSFLAGNKAINIARLGIPVLYLDTELVSTVQQDRMTSIVSGIPLKMYETSSFKNYKEYVDLANYAKHEMSKMPIWHISIAGMSHSEALGIARRWLVKHVGLDENGKANDCAIIYDYFKLTGEIGLQQKEYIALGVMLSDIHNFAVKYDVPIQGLVQLNRDGIDNEDTSIVAGSDRIAWLCSSLAIMKDKSTQDEDSSCGWDHGNKKLKVIASRYGPGMSNDNDYINLVAELHPNTSPMKATGRIKEGKTYSQVLRENGNRQ